jgi:hypothetical protein
MLKEHTSGYQAEERTAQERVGREVSEDFAVTKGQARE